MEEILKRIVNLGIGAVKSIEDNLSATFKEAEKGINELIARGEATNEGRAARVKEFTEQLISSLKEYEQRAKELSENLQATLNDFNSAGNARLDELNKKIEELAAKFRFNKKQTPSA